MSGPSHTTDPSKRIAAAALRAIADLVEAGSPVALTDFSVSPSPAVDNLLHLSIRLDVHSLEAYNDVRNAVSRLLARPTRTGG